MCQQQLAPIYTDHSEVLLANGLSAAAASLSGLPILFSRAESVADTLLRSLSISSSQLRHIQSTRLRHLVAPHLSSHQLEG